MAHHATMGDLRSGQCKSSGLVRTFAVGENLIPAAWDGFAWP
jgi:hypothetical protein